ncbi:hypothetical protein [Veillonella caviae]|uniref:hypothetical protein n=2 Tax=Veillonella caviae TaxID=248316 RepID=UPI0023F7DA04|nr:hypothetical protein [Veillonella caviae]
MLIFWSLVRNSVVLAVYLLFSVACFLTVHEHWLGQSIDSYEISGTYTLINNGLFMVKADLGSAIAIDGLVNTEGTDLCTIPLSPTLTVNSSIIWRKNQALSQASQLFLDTLQEEISNHSKE